MHSLKKRLISYFLVLGWFFRSWNLRLADLYVSPNVSPGFVWPSRTTSPNVSLDTFGLLTSLAGTSLNFRNCIYFPVGDYCLLPLFNWILVCKIYRNTEFLSSFVLIFQRAQTKKIPTSGSAIGLCTIFYSYVK